MQTVSLNKKSLHLFYSAFSKPYKQWAMSYKKEIFFVLKQSQIRFKLSLIYESTHDNDPISL